MESTNDRVFHAPKSNPTPLYSDVADQYLSRKHFLLIPSPLMEWLWHAPIRPTSKDLFLVYWNDAMAKKKPGQPLTACLSVAFAARKLGVSEVAVRKANQELREQNLIDRVRKHNAIGKTVCCQTIICLPESLAKHLDATPDRNKERGLPVPEHDGVQEIEKISPSLPDYPSAISPFATDEPEENNEKAKSTKHVKKQNSSPPDETVAKEITKLVARSKELDDLIRKGHIRNIAEHDRVVRELETIGERLRELRSRKTEPPLKSEKPSNQAARAPTAVKPTKPVRVLRDEDRKYIKQRLEGIENLSSPKEAFEEVVFHVTRGAYAGDSIPIRKAINISLKLIRNGQWRTPAGYGNYRNQHLSNG